MSATTLTDRYVAAVVRGVPTKQRSDLDRELRTAIADAIDDRVAAGGDAASAEHDAVLELGDPIVLAAGYSGSPLHLIGPTLYPDWKRLVTVLELIVVPIVLVTIPTVWLFRGESIGDAIGAGAWIAFETAVQLAFWITVTFAIVERSTNAAAKLVPWTPDLLPDTSTEPTRRSVLWTAGFASVFVAVFVLSWFVSPFTGADGAAVTFLHPWIVESGLAIILVAGPVLQIGAAALQLSGRWNLATAIGAIVVDAAIGVAMVTLGATDRILNPAFIDAAGWPDLVAPIVNVTFVCLGVLAIIASVWENLHSLRRQKDQRARTPAAHTA